MNNRSIHRNRLREEYANLLNKLLKNNVFLLDLGFFIEDHKTTSDPNQAVFKEGARSVLHFLKKASRNEFKEEQVIVGNTGLLAQDPCKSPLVEP